MNTTWKIVDSYRDTKIALKQINNLVVFGDLVCWCQKKESKVHDGNNGCNPVLSIIPKETDYFPRTLMIENERFKVFLTIAIPFYPPQYFGMCSGRKILTFVT